ncbi:hypothetical protein [Salinisphaera sp. LB1]|uniref:hypothetical protein n=1 Tax=Salinisphaera sp. LB1 TaxID=2183911 RepID=UPI0011AB8030|nr:hypothetical protein [Salinisphaera sp. LB1]
MHNAVDKSWDKCRDAPVDKALPRWLTIRRHAPPSARPCVFTARRTPGPRQALKAVMPRDTFTAKRLRLSEKMTIVFVVIAAVFDSFGQIPRGLAPPVMTTTPRQATIPAWT